MQCQMSDKGFAFDALRDRGTDSQLFDCKERKEAFVTGQSPSQKSNGQYFT